MSISSKLTFWFIIAALLPAIMITLFAVNEASRRFSERAMSELDEAGEEGAALLQNFKSELTDELARALTDASFNEFAARFQDQENFLAELNFASDFNDSLNLEFNFLTFFDDDGIVLSSLEWPAFAGIRYLTWEEITSLDSGSFLVSAANTSNGELLAIRCLLRTQGITVVGGKSLGNWFLPQFRTSGRLLVFLNDPVSNDVLAEDNTTLALSRALENLMQKSSGNLPEQITLSSKEYFVNIISLDPERASETSIIFLYSRSGLDEEIAGLWTTFSLAAFAGLVLAFVLGLTISKRVAQPIRQLIYGFDLVALGDFSYRLKKTRNDELGDILNSFNRMVVDLENVRRQLLRSERVAAWQEIARKIAHEIKNPLSPIQISIETLRKVHQRKHPEFESIFQESTQTVLEEVEKIRTIVQEFSDFARMPEPSFQPTNLHEVIEKVVRLFKTQLEEIKLTQELKKVPDVNADPEQLHRLLVNLIGNALDALDGKGELSLKLDFLARGKKKRNKAQEKGFVRMTVADSGPGLDKEDLGKIFTPYFSTKVEGTGLGLVIVQKIVEQHGGRLNFRSAPGEGTQVEIYLKTF